MKRPLFVAVADAHCHPFPEFNTFDEYGGSSRVLATCRAISASIDFAEEHGVAWWSLGDLLHTKKEVSSYVFKDLRTALGRASGPLHLIVGNHELPDKFSTATSLDWLLSEDSIYHYTQPMKVYHDLVDIVVFPVTHDLNAAKQKLYEIVCGFDPNRPRILLGHGMIDGCAADNGMRLSSPGMSPADLYFDAFNLVLFGDIHKHQQVHHNAWYAGALLPQNFGERDNPPGFIVVYEDLSWVRIPVAAPRFEYVQENATGSQVTPSGEVVFQRPDPKAIAQKATQSAVAPRLEMNLTSLVSMLTAYMHANKPPVGVTPDAVLAEIQECLS